MNFLISPAPSIFDEIINNVPESTIRDISGTIFFVLCLLIIDISLRVSIECIRCLHFKGKSLTVKNLILTLIWYGWGEYKDKDDTIKRFLISKKFRTAVLLKMTCQYPLLFLFSYLSYSLPDFLIYSWRFDKIISSVFLLMPVICELTSIIEKLNLLNSQLIKFYFLFIRIIKDIRK